MGTESSKHKPLNDPELLPAVLAWKPKPSLERRILQGYFGPRSIGSSSPQRRPSVTISPYGAVQEEPRQHRSKHNPNSEPGKDKLEPPARQNGSKAKAKPTDPKPAKDKLKPLAQQTGLTAKPSKRRKHEPKRFIQKKKEQLSPYREPVRSDTWRAPMAYSGTMVAKGQCDSVKLVDISWCCQLKFLNGICIDLSPYGPSKEVMMRQHAPSKELLTKQYLARDLKDCVAINLNQVYAEHVS
jgi:hypothetical protein